MSNLKSQNHNSNPKTNIKYWLCLLRDGTEIDKIKINKLLKEAEEISNMLGSSLLTLKGKKQKF